MIGHLILISAQVQSKAGVPVLEGDHVRRVFAGSGRRRRDSSAASAASGATTSVCAARKAENEKLKQELAALEVRLQEQRALASRAERLQALLDLRAVRPFPTIAAEVIAGNPNPGLMTVTIDRGTADGVQADMAVIAPKGVVGRVVGPVAAHAARVQLIIDRNAAAGAISERARAGGMAVGVDGDPPLADGAGLEPCRHCRGGLVVASGVDGIYPKGFAIGTVEKSGAGPEPAPDHRGPARGRLFRARGSARRAGAGAKRASSTAESPPRRKSGEVRTIGVLIALAGALALQTTLAGLTIAGALRSTWYWWRWSTSRWRSARWPDFSPVRSAVWSRTRWPAGSSASAGFRRRSSGSWSVVLGAQFIVAQPLPRFVMFVGGTFVHELCYQALYALVESRAFRMPWSAALTQAVINGVIGILAFQIVEWAQD